MVKTRTAGRNGVIKVLEKNYYMAPEVMEILGVGRSKAYQIIQSLRQELISSGKLLQEYPNGRIPKGYFDKRCGMNL